LQGTVQVAGCCSDATSKIYNEQLKLKDDIVQTTLENARVVENQDLKAKRAWHSSRQAAAFTGTQTAIVIDDLARRIKGLERVIGDQNIANSHDKAMNAMDQVADDQVNLQFRLDRLDQSDTAISSGIQGSTATVRELLRLKDMPTLHLRNLRLAPASLAMSEESARISLTLTLPKLGISTHDLKVLLKGLSGSGDHTWILSSVVLHLSEKHHFGSATNRHYLGDSTMSSTHDLSGPAQ
jgi:hypothetical protein